MIPSVASDTGYIRLSSSWWYKWHEQNEMSHLSVWCVCTENVDQSLGLCFLSKSCLICQSEFPKCAPLKCRSHHALLTTLGNHKDAEFDMQLDISRLKQRDCTILRATFLGWNILICKWLRLCWLRTRARLWQWYLHPPDGREDPPTRHIYGNQ